MTFCRLILVGISIACLMPTYAQESGKEKINTKYDFIPGNRVLFIDSFSEVNLGDFPEKWNTNGSGEVVTLKSTEGKWLKLTGNTGYVPKVIALPDNYTIEFDFLTTGLNDDHSLENALFKFVFGDKAVFDEYDVPNRAVVKFPLWKIERNNYIHIENRGVEPEISNDVAYDIPGKLNSALHFAIARNKNRLRLWINQDKVIDLPALIPPGAGKSILLYLQETDASKGQQVLISNFKIAESGKDFRSSFAAEGKITTPGIYFKTGASDIKSESYGVLKDIGTILKADPKLKIKIIGHTDDDGDEKANLILSQKRALAVKDFLVQHFNVSEANLQTEGKGESEPASSNTTAENKAMNRRVEFVKIN